MERLDPEGLNRDLRNGRCEACGGGPIISVMLAAKALGANRGKVLRYLNSGDVTGDRSRVVGYGAGVFFKTMGGTDKMREVKKVGVDLGLNEEDKKTLHHIAKTVIENMARGKPVPEFKVDAPILKESRGAFVTINKKGQLRGCIGHIEGHGPVYKTVEEMAAAAAFQDPRFNPVTERELPDLEVEISVLTPLKGSPTSMKSKLESTESTLRRVGTQAFFSPKWQPNTGGIATFFLSTPARKPAFLRMPGRTRTRRSISFRPTSFNSRPEALKGPDQSRPHRFPRDCDRWSWLAGGLCRHRQEVIRPFRCPEPGSKPLRS
jgi:AmmeMemoRadiSam system protein A